MREISRLVRPIGCIAAVALLAAALPIWPYAYFMLLRVLVFAAGAWCAFAFWHEGRRGAAVAFALVAVTFNPFLPIHMPRGAWAVVDVGCAILFGAFAAARKADRAQPRCEGNGHD